MHNIDKILDYLEYDFATGWPAGENLFYECQCCGAVLSTTLDGQCKCGNVYVDISAGRAGAKDESSVRLAVKHSVRPAS